MPIFHRYCVYILECSDESFYVGVTNNVELRLRQHQQGINEGCYTFDKRPVSLRWTEEFQYIDKAIAFEKKLKGWLRAKKQALINGVFEKLPELSKKKFD